MHTSRNLARRCSIPAAVLPLLAGLLLPVSPHVPATAQDRARIAKDEIGWIYAQARFQSEFRRFEAREGALVVPASLDRHAVASDTLSAWIMAQAAKALPPAPEPPWTGEVHSWALVKRTQRLRHRQMFEETRMAYVGNDQFTALDTTATPRLRAKMQSAFGDPTQTIVEVLRGADPMEYIQFEYWFVVNDSIPVVVMDAHGPHDHGVVLAGDHRFRELLPMLRQSLLGRALREAPYGAYVDYFYDELTESWLRTGYDGAGFFVETISPPDLVRGRPRLAAPGQ